MTTVRVRNDHGEGRVVPHLGYSLVQAGQVLDVPDREAYHWAAGGFTVLDRYPVPEHLHANHAADPLAYPDPALDPLPGARPLAAAAGAPVQSAPGPEPQPAAPADAPEPEPAPAAPAALPEGEAA